MKKIIILVLAAFVALPTMAANNVKFMVSEDASYDDNIYNKKDEKGSFISSTHVGADYRANIPNSGLKLAATGNVGYNAYTENQSKNNYWDALGQVQLSNEQFKLGDRFLFTSDPANNAETDRAKRINNNAYVSYKTSAEKLFSFGVTVNDVLDNYMESAFNYLSRNRLNLGAQVYYNLSNKTSLFVEYQYSDISYKNTSISDSYGNRLGLGITGDITAKVTGKAAITYDMRDYKHDYEGADAYTDLLGYYVSLEWKPSTQNVIRLSGERRMEETLYFGSRYFADTNVSLYASQKIMDKLTAAVTLSYDNMDYNANDRIDDFYSVRPEVSYQFKNWLTAGVWYQFRTRHSNEGYAEYDNNRVGVYAKALF